MLDLATAMSVRTGKNQRLALKLRIKEEQIPELYVSAVEWSTAHRSAVHESPKQAVRNLPLALAGTLINDRRHWPSRSPAER